MKNKVSHVLLPIEVFELPPLILIAIACISRTVCSVSCIADVIRYTIPFGACALSATQYLKQVGFFNHLASIHGSAQRYLVLHGIESVICVGLTAAAIILAAKIIARILRRKQKPFMKAIFDREGKSGSTAVLLFKDAKKSDLLTIIEEKMKTLHIDWETLLEAATESTDSGKSIGDLAPYEAVIVDGLDSLISHQERQTSLTEAIQRLCDEDKVIILLGDGTNQFSYLMPTCCLECLLSL